MARPGMSRLVLAVIVALLLTGVFASAVVAWDATCSSGEACVWKNGSFQVPAASQSAQDLDYTNDNYPNTQDTLNDSVSSIRNTKASIDVIWYFDINHNGTSFCLDSGWESGQLNSHNDQYSSHILAVSTTCQH